MFKNDKNLHHVINDQSEFQKPAKIIKYTLSKQQPFRILKIVISIQKICKEKKKDTMIKTRK